MQLDNKTGREKEFHWENLSQKQMIPIQQYVYSLRPIVFTWRPANAIIDE